MLKAHICLSLVHKIHNIIENNQTLLIELLYITSLFNSYGKWARPDTAFEFESSNIIIRTIKLHILHAYAKGYVCVCVISYIISHGLWLYRHHILHISWVFITRRNLKCCKRKAFSGPSFRRGLWQVYTACRLLKLWEIKHRKGKGGWRMLLECS